MTWRIVPLVLAVQVALGLGSASVSTDRMPEAVRKAFRPWQERAPRGPVRLDREFMVDTSIVLGPSPGYDGNPDAATDGNGWLVAWNGGDGNTVVAARLSAGGALVDTAAVRISPPGSSPSVPRVAFNGTDYVVAWAEMSMSQVLAARVTTGGLLRDSVPIVLGTGWMSAAIAAAGETCLVAWNRDDGLHQRVFAARLTADGTVLDPGGFRVSYDSADVFIPEVAPGAGGFLVVWTTYTYDTTSYENDVVAARVSLGGQVLDTVPIPVGAKQGWAELDPAVGFNGNEYLVAWVIDTIYDWTPTVQCRRLTSGGVVIDTAVINLPLAGGSSSGPDVAAESGSFMVTWPAYDTMNWVSAAFGCRVSTAGVVLDSVPFLVSDSGCGGTVPRVSSGPGKFLAAWSQSSGRSSDIHTARVSVQGTVLDTPSVLLSYGADEQGSPRVAACSTNALAAWFEWGEAGYALHAGRMSRTGAVLDPRGFQVSAGPCYGLPPGLAFGAGEYLVAWTGLEPGPAGLYAARVTADGVLLDTNGIAVCTTSLFAPLAPHVAFDGANFLVTWSNADTMGAGSAILAARVRPDGMVLDPDPITVADEDVMDVISIAVFNGQDYVVSWMASDASYDYDLKLKRMRPDGVLLDTVPRVLSAADREQMWQSGAASGETTLFVWMDYRSGTECDVYGARVDRAGHVLDPNGLLVSEQGPDDEFPGVVWTGGDFHAFWVAYGVDSVDIAGARLSRDGSVIERFTAAQGSANFVSPAVFPTGEKILTWDGYAGEYLGRRYDCYRIWGKMGPFAGVAEPGAVRVVRARPPTVVRGALRLPGSPSSIRYSLFDLSGREVRRLSAGLNDVRLLSPGVYFVRPAGRDGRAAQKVVITK